VVKVLVSAFLAFAFAIPGRRLQLAVGLGQIGEFSFVVLGLGVAAGVVTAAQSSGALAAAAVTIAASAVAVRWFPRLS
jgi:CPA2 family monovalent cation:H+ antiporter-2